MPTSKKTRVTRVKKSKPVLTPSIPNYGCKCKVPHRIYQYCKPGFTGGPPPDENPSFLGDRIREIDPGWYDATKPSWLNPIYLLMDGPPILKRLFTRSSIRGFVNWWLKMKKYPLSDAQRSQLAWWVFYGRPETADEIFMQRYV